LGVVAQREQVLERAAGSKCPNQASASSIDSALPDEDTRKGFKEESENSRGVDNCYYSLRLLSRIFCTKNGLLAVFLDPLALSTYVQLGRAILAINWTHVMPSLSAPAILCSSHSSSKPAFICGHTYPRCTVLFMIHHSHQGSLISPRRPPP
jgi:hypothetical protein